MSKISKDVLNVINKKSGKQVSEQSIKKIASTVTPRTFNNATELRSLILKVSKMANIPVSAATVNEIIRAVKANGNTGSLEQLIKSMIGK